MKEWTEDEIAAAEAQWEQRCSEGWMLQRAGTPFSEARKAAGILLQCELNEALELLTRAKSSLEFEYGEGCATYMADWLSRNRPQEAGVAEPRK